MLPLLPFLLDLGFAPNVVRLISLEGGGALAIMGLIILFVNAVNESPYASINRDFARAGFILFGMGIAIMVFHVYLIPVSVLGALGTICYTLVKNAQYLGGW